MNKICSTLARARGLPAEKSHVVKQRAKEQSVYVFFKIMADGCFPVVSFAAVIRVVTRHATLLKEERCVTSDDPNNGCEGD